MADKQKLRESYDKLKTGTLWSSTGRCKGYEPSNPAEADKIDAYVDGIVADGNPAPPDLATATGDGIVGIIEAGFPHAAEPTPEPTPPPTLTVRQNIADGQTLTGPVAWSAVPSAPIARCDFYVDGAGVWTEYGAPYVCNGDGKQFDPSTLADGVHTLKVNVRDAAGLQATVTAAVTVHTETAPAPTPTPPPPGGVAGRLRYMMYATSQSDAYVPIANKPWCDAHWERAICWDPPMTWLSQGWPYKDASALYKGTTHMDWVIKDTRGMPVYLRGYSPTNPGGFEYLADVGNAAFRADFIAWAKARTGAGGHVGVYLDDVNITLNFVTETNAIAQAVDPRTGKVLTREVWCEYFCDFLEMLRAAVPDVEIFHNPVWFHSPNHDGNDPWVQRQILAADFSLAERGFCDTGFTGGTGMWSIHRFLVWCDTVHKLGRGVGFLGYGNTVQNAELNLAGGLIASNGRDFFYSDYGWGKTNWWVGNDVNLGADKGARSYVSGLFRRDFDQGIALLLEPGASSRSVSLGGTFKRLDGSSVTSVTIGPRQGIVLTK